MYIDSKKYKSDFIATTNKFKKLGFETFLDIDTLSYGKHVLEITRKRIRNKDTTNLILAKIPFWRFKK